MEMRKATLEALKEKDKKAFTEEQQAELDSLSAAYKAIKGLLYVVPKGTEKMVHLMVYRGRRFSPETGKEISKPFAQVFSYGEWCAFRNNFTQLGWRIMEVLHDPYNEAEQYVVKAK